MSNNLTLAGKHACRLFRDLMACVILFCGDLGFGVVLADEYDGDPGAIIHEYDPFN